MVRLLRRGWETVVLAVAAGVLLAACSTADVRTETVASVNGDEIKVAELRDFLGLRGGVTPAVQVPADRKKEALDRLIAGRLLSQEARSRGLDNTEDFKAALSQNEQAVWVTALFRKEMASREKIDEKQVQAEVKNLKEAEKGLSDADAALRATQMVSEKQARKVEGDLIAAAKKETASSIDQEMTQKIGKGETVGDNAVLATAGSEKIRYGDVKQILRAMSPGGHGGQDLSRNPAAIERVLDREITGRALLAYAKKQGIEGSAWIRDVRKDLERSVLINLLAEKVVLKEMAVTDKDIEEAYVERGQMFMRGGKKIPLAEVREQIRAFLQNSKRRKALEEYIAELKKKAKIVTNEGLLPKV